MRAEERSLLEALQERSEAGRLLQNLDALQDAGSIAGNTGRELRQEYVDRILAAEHEIARLKDALAGRLSSLQGEPARRLRAVIDAETAADLEAILADHLPARGPSADVRQFPSPSAHPGRHLRPLAIGLACAGIAAFALLQWGLPAVHSLRDALPGGSRDPAVTVSLVTGDRVEVGTGQVGAAGGSLAVSGTGGPLDGLTLDVPPGSYPQPVTFDLSYEPIEDFSAPDGVEVLTPLIHLDASTTDYAGGLVAVTVPAVVPEGHFASLFIYDEESRTLKGMPTLEEADGSLTMLSTHLCPIVALSAPYERLAAPAGKASVDLDSLKVSTGFRPERDMWNLVNAGSVVASGGCCHGMSLSSLYHFMLDAPTHDTPLWKSEYDNGLPEGMGTPGFWQDDRFAIQLCSLASTLGTTRESGGVLDALRARVAQMEPQTPDGRDARQFYLTALALHVTGAPQLLGVHCSSGGGGHSLLCYGVDGHALLIADPNYPGKPDIKLEFKDGRLGAYRSAQNAKDIAAGKYILYDSVFYVGDISLFNLGKLERYWSDYEAGGLDGLFPRYTVKVTELDETGAAGQSYTLDVLSGIRTEAARLRFDIESGAESRLTLYRYGNPPSTISGNVVEPEDGDSHLGFLVEQKTKYGWEWADFNWVRVSATGEQPSPPAPGRPGFNYCTVTVEFDAVLKDTYSGEVRQKGNESISCSLFGTFSGNTFTGRVDEVVKGFFPEDDSTNKARLTVTLDADFDEVTSFSLETEWAHKCGGILRYTATGSGAKRYMGGIDELGLFLSGSEEEGMPRPSITWLEREPEQGPGCPGGYRTYDVLSAENFSVLIQLMERDPVVQPR